ncbi:hypothetical protein G6F65_017957 [Rhizopus arrhizus]|nr:hypothetical protein G6F65_017957 [Rhizopus arrhizus]
MATDLTGWPAYRSRKCSVHATSNPQLAGRSGATSTPCACRPATQAPSEPSLAQLPPPKARTTASVAIVRTPSGVSNRNPSAEGASLVAHPSPRCRIWKRTPEARNRASHARSNGAAFISSGKTRPDEPTKVWMPSSCAQSRNAVASMTESQGATCAARSP